MPQDDISIQDDPARKPPNVTKGQIEYRIYLGPCQTKAFDLFMKSRTYYEGKRQLILSIVA